jgi:DNA replication protein DnaC
MGDGVDCPECLNRGYIARAANGTVVSHECPCMARRRSLRALERSGLRHLVDEYTFERYETPEEWQREAKRAAMAYVADGGGGQWFCMSGAVGSGKTHLCTAICAALIAGGKSARYMRWRDDSSKLKAAITDAPEYARLIEPLKMADVLYIDDLLKTEHGRSPTQGDVNLAFELLNARYINRELITLISSERSARDLLRIDEAVGSRIYERSKGWHVEISGAGKNYRLREMDA